MFSRVKVWIVDIIYFFVRVIWGKFILIMVMFGRGGVLGALGGVVLGCLVVVVVVFRLIIMRL